MTSIKLTVTGAQAQASVTGPLTSGMVGVPIPIEYDEAWAGLTKNLVCRCGEWGDLDGAQRTILNVGDAATVAHEVMKAGMSLYLGLEGYSPDGKLVIPTTWAKCEEKIQIGANSGAELSADPTLPIWDQLQTEIEQLKQGTLTPEQIADIQAATQEATASASRAEAAAARAENAANTSQNATVEPAEDDIPKVYFTGTLPTDKANGDLQLHMRYVSKTADFAYPVTLKVQGSSSTSFPKKNFTLKVYEDDTYENKKKLAFKGWGKMNKFVLKAHWIDHSHVRNVGTAKIWGKIVASRADYASLPEELRSAPNNGATDGFTVKVFANGIYQGLYEWIVPKDKLFGQDSDIATHSILNSEWNNQPTCAFATTTPTIDGNWSEELQDDMSVGISASFANLITFVAGSTDEEFTANIENYVDLQSVIDFDIFARVFCIIDNLCRNQIFFTYDGAKWYEGCWDVDAVLGLNVYGGISNAHDKVFQTGYLAYVDYGITNMLYQRVEECFTERVKERYFALRERVLSASSIIEVYERLTDTITAHEGLLAEDFASTTADGAFTGIPSQSTNNIQQIRNFIAKRLGYMDSTMEVLGEASIYSVTANLTGCSIDNSTSTVVEGESYTATLTEDSGYTLNTVSVIMGGVDITSEVYSEGVITIPSITDDVIITAVANAKEPTVYEYAPTIYADATGAITAYSASGAATNYYLYQYDGSAYNKYTGADAGAFSKQDIEVTAGQVITIEYSALSVQASAKTDMYVYDARKFMDNAYFFVPSDAFDGEPRTVTFTATASGTLVIGGFYNTDTGYGDTPLKANFNGKYIKVSIV